MTRRFLSFLVALVVLCSCMAATAHADTDDNWTQVLSYSTVNNSGSNYFVVNKSATIILDLPARTYGVWVDMLVNTSDMDINTVYSIWQGSYTKLTASKIADGLYRVFGRLSYHTYTQLKFQFNCTGTGYYELLSCKISAISQTILYADADMDIWYMSWNGDTQEQNHYLLEQSSSITLGEGGAGDSCTWQSRVNIYDWENYDSITVWGSVDQASVHSVRASLGNEVLPTTINWIDIETGEYYTDPNVKYPEVYGKYLYAITIDTSTINRAQDQSALLLYMTGKYWDNVGMIMSFQYATGALEVADTESATWWNRFTTFMTGLFSPDDSMADDFQNEAEQQGSEMDELNQQMQEVTKPPVEDIEIDIDDYLSPDDLASVTGEFAQITGDETVITMLMMSLTVALVAYILYGKR